MTFNASLEITNDTAKIVLSGELDATAAPAFKQKVEEAAAQPLKCLILLAKDLEYIASAGLRVLIFAKQKMGTAVDIYLVGANEMAIDTIEKAGFHHSLIVRDKI
jgi:anti-anti-sigma factor